MHTPIVTLRAINWAVQSTTDGCHWGTALRYISCVERGAYPHPFTLLERLFLRPASVGRGAVKQGSGRRGPGMLQLSSGAQISLSPTKLPPPPLFSQAGYRGGGRRQKKSLCT